MTGNNRMGGEAKNNYEAFAPGFSDESKTAYRRSVKDTVQIDQQYMT